jgi:hypothetical protein
MQHLPESFYTVHAVTVKRKGKSLRYVRQPKYMFRADTLRRRKIDAHTTLIVGRLQPKYAHLQGAGLWDWIKQKANAVKEVFKPKLGGYNNTSTKTLNEVGDRVITGAYLLRTPVQSLLNSALNLISLGKWDELRQKYAYDKLYHLSLVVDVGDKKVIIEKNATVNVSTAYSHRSNSEIQPVSLQGKQIKLNDLLSTARSSVGDTTFFKYNAFNLNGGTNCQRFLQLVLQANGLITPEADKFIMQDVTELSKELPDYVKNTAQVVTDMGAIANRLTGGKRDNNKMNRYLKRKVDSLFV